MLEQLFIIRFWLLHTENICFCCYWSSFLTRNNVFLFVFGIFYFGFFFTFCLILTWLCAWWKNPWIWMSSLFFNYFFTCQNLDSTICFVTLPLSGILSSMHYFSHRVPFLNLFIQDYTFRNHFYSSLNFSFFFHTQQHIWHSIN